MTTEPSFGSLCARMFPGTSSRASMPRARRASCAVGLTALLFAGIYGAQADQNTPENAARIEQDPREDGNFWGMGTGAEWMSAYPSFNPRLKHAGVRWLRAFYEWAEIQPEPGVWNWTLVDRLVKNSRANNLRQTGGFLYFAPWASADGSTRTFPIKDMQYWRDYVRETVDRYQKDIKYWEIWNEFNGSFAVNGTPQIYADLVREASRTAKAIDPGAKIGMSVANFDLHFLAAAIKAGAAGYFDYICVHPYENLGALMNNGEVGFLGLAGKLRAMLKAHDQNVDIPLWINEIGILTPVKPDAEKDRAQAEGLAKTYLLALASGFQRVFWFEVRGPSYGNDSDFGIIRADGSARPAYFTLKTLTTLLGPNPKYAGWLNLDQGGYGFLFEGADQTVLAAWSPRGQTHAVSFTSPARVTDLAGEETSHPAKKTLALTAEPVLITRVPKALEEEARRNKDQPFPWGGDPSGAEVAVSRLGATNEEQGLQQLSMDTTIPGASTDETWRETDFSRADSEGRYAYFQLHPRFAPYGTRDFEITAVVRGIAPGKTAGTNLDYESVNGYVSANRYLTIPTDGKWHELVWNVNDADFVGGWAWNFRLNAMGSPNQFEIKEVRIRKLAGKAQQNLGLNDQSRSLP